MSTKWGIVSAGKICHDFVTSVQSNLDNNHEFVAVAARNLSSAQEFAAAHNIPKAYGSYEELAKDPTVEVVYVGTITTYHFEVGKLMLENGKHVLIEIPMGLNAKQTKTLIEIARKQKRFLMEALWSRFLPAYKYFLEQINIGSIGDVVHANVNFGLPLLNIERLMKKNTGGGTIVEFGDFTLNAVTMACGGKKPDKIAAVGHLNEDGVDIAVNCSLKYSENKTASVNISALAKFTNDLVIVGTKGQIRVLDPFWSPTKVEVNGEIHEFKLPESVKPCNYTDNSGMRYEAEEVRECIKKGKLESSIMPLKDSEMFAELMDDIRHQLGFYFEED